MAISCPRDGCVKAQGLMDPAERRPHGRKLSGTASVVYTRLNNETGVLFFCNYQYHRNPMLLVVMESIIIILQKE